MKKFALLLALTVGLSPVAAALAQNSGFQDGAAGQGGGFTGPAAAANTVAEALKMGDDVPVRLSGRIERRLSGEKYLFADKTGSIIVDIDDKDWRGLSVGPQNTVEIYGEIDKDWNEINVDVDSLRLIK